MFTRRQLFFAAPALAAKTKLRIAPFEADVTPPKGAPLCYSLVVPAERTESPLKAKGVVLFPSGQKPIVLCAVDWLGIGGKSHVDWRMRLALAIGTTPDRVAVQTVHQHDAPGDDLGALALLPKSGRGEILSPASFCREAVTNVVLRMREAKPVEVSHWAFGEARVDRIACNRRILSPDGKTFLFQRFTACRNSPYCDAPEGVIDPMVKTLSFYAGEKRLASLHYYATHPMSYYGKGVVNPDFVGIARDSLPGFHVYFTGAAGNVGAGKYNDGAPENRARLAERLAAAMNSSLESEKRRAVGRVDWKSAELTLPVRQGAEFSEGAMRMVLDDPKAADKDLASAARYLAWHQRPRTILQALRLESSTVLHMPGELFVEYQLAGQQEKKSDVVAMAAYGDYAPMYIGTRKSYSEGGYETSLVSRVGEGAEDILRSSMQRLLA